MSVLWLDCNQITNRSDAHPFIFGEFLQVLITPLRPQRLIVWKLQIMDSRPLNVMNLVTGWNVAPILPYVCVWIGVATIPGTTSIWPRECGFVWSRFIPSL